MIVTDLCYSHACSFCVQLLSRLRSLHAKESSVKITEIFRSIVCMNSMCVCVNFENLGGKALGKRKFSGQLCTCAEQDADNRPENCSRTAIVQFAFRY